MIKNVMMYGQYLVDQEAAAAGAAAAASVEELVGGGYGMPSPAVKPVVDGVAKLSLGEKG